MRKMTIALVFTGLFLSAASPAIAGGYDGRWDGDLPLYRKAFTSSNCKAWSACSDLDGYAVDYVDVSEEMDAAREKIDEDPDDDYETVWANVWDKSSPFSDMRVCWYDDAKRLLDCARDNDGLIAAPVPYDTDHAKIIVLSGVDTPWGMQFDVMVDFTQWF